MSTSNPKTLQNTIALLQAETSEMERRIPDFRFLVLQLQALSERAPKKSTQSK